MRADLKKTTHNYRGFTIHGTQYKTCGGYVLGGRHFVEGGIARNYNVKKDGRYIFNPNDLLTTLKFTKEEIDRYITSKSLTNEISN